ncbi:prolyl oligopeptidase family serine peptidase [uncultured Gimesia sp.]|uniref:alpha/beta hydrolase family protein n=1 Tax=uncultured Gimesia sp. TaxID=1678688 RepID=UPI0030DBA2D3|tara:strand:- start:2496 stop:3383 length:888 start_codon:yes stop_codon:yes gene_type:complete
MKPLLLLFRIFFITFITTLLLFPESKVYTSTKDTGISEWTGKQDKWHGFQRVHFQIDGRKCYVVIPTKSAPGKPWVWRARFPDFHYEMDVELLKRGFHIAYMDVANLFGSPQAIKHGDKFYDYLTKKHGFQSKVALEGVSRGGLFIYNWALENPEKVSCIYADTPVCDFKSWPGGKGKSQGSSASWKTCLNAYGMTEAEALAYKNNPLDRIQIIAEARIPVLHIVSENDQVVPPAENTYLMFSRVPEQYRKDNFKVISVKTGTEKSKGHHFQHPQPDQVVSFIVQHSQTKKSKPN